MRTFILITIFCFTVSLVYAEVKQEAQKFEVTYTIVYNTQTLEEAAAKEELIKAKFKDACSVSIAMHTITTWDGTVSYFTEPALTYTQPRKLK